MPDGDEVKISASMEGDLVAALQVAEEQVEDTGDAAERMGAKGETGGRAYARGMDEAAKSTRRARDAQGKFLPANERSNESLGDTTRKSRTAGKGLDYYARQARQAARSSGGLAAALMATKWSLFLTGGMAVIGMLSALAAGAVIAVGALAPMLGVAAALGPGMFMLAAAIAAVKLGGEQVGSVFKPVGQDFKAFGDDIRAVLLPGVRNLADALRADLVPVLGGGLISVADYLGDVADLVANWVRYPQIVNRFGGIMQGLGPIIFRVSQGLLNLASAVLDITYAALPMVTEMADGFVRMSGRLETWTAAQVESGRMAAWLLKAWHTMRAVGSVLADVIVGIYNVFRIAAGYGRELGTSVADGAQRFRDWTASAEGAARINRYFADALPTFRETVHLLGAIVAGLGHLAANPNVAPLLNQIRTELGPALGDLLAKVTGPNGVGPALITMFTEVAKAMAAMPTGPLAALIMGLAGLVQGVSWLVANVPFLAPALSGLIAALIAMKVALWGAGKALSIADDVMKLGGYVWDAAQLAWKGLKLIGTGLLWLGRMLVTAIMANPVIAAIVLIIGIIIFLWMKFAWFRDMVTAMWEWIKGVAIAVWNAILTAVTAVVGALVAAVTWVRDVAVGVWNAIVTATITAWNAVKNAVLAAVNFIVMVAMWIWDHGLKQVLTVIMTAFGIAFAIIAFIVQTAVFIIMAIIAGIAWVMEQTWKIIVGVVKWAWENVIRPVFEAIKTAWNAVTGAISAAWNWVVNAITIAWNAFYNNVIAPVNAAIALAWNTVTGLISAAWNAVVTALTTAWNAFYNAAIQPVISAISSAWNMVTGVMSSTWNATVGGLTNIWNGFKSVVGGVIDWIRKIWGELTGWLGRVFTPVGKAIEAVWDGIKVAAETVGGIIKGIWDGIIGAIKAVWNGIANVWNSIPSITVPDWVPLVGGKTFGLPKMPKLWHGGYAPGGVAVTGEQGPEPVIKDGKFLGMVGLRGPEVTSIPRGGYVVPNLDTLNRLPGLAKSLPAGVARAVAASVPGYSGVIERGHSDSGAIAVVHTGGPDTSRLEGAIRDLTEELRNRPPTVHASGADVHGEVYRAIKRIRREEDLDRRYSYHTGGN